MLYITRKRGQAIIINNEIEIEIVEIKSKTIKLGCSYPSNYTILRKEIYDKISQENIAAISSTLDEDS